MWTAEFGGANRVLIALLAEDGDMFQPGFFDALKLATDEVLVMDGIDRARVQSLFTPNVRYMEVVEDGIEAGNVVDSEFVPTPERATRSPTLVPKNPFSMNSRRPASTRSRRVWSPRARR